jgi:hypothetical protein
MTRTLVPTVTLLLLAACGSGDGTTPADLVPASLRTVVNPARTFYVTGQEVAFLGLVQSATLEEIPDVEIEWTLEPASRAAVVSDRGRELLVTLASTGTVTVTGCLAGGTPQGPLCDAAVLTVDDGAPTLEVRSPRPGDQLVGPDPIVVTGNVADAGMAVVYVDGAPVEVDAAGDFATTVIPAFGVNHVTVTASDGLTPAETVEMDVLWAPAYSPAVSADGARPEVALEDGLVLSLGQRFFDDGLPLDPSTEPVTTEDLADLVELVVGSVDVGELLPDPVIDAGGLTLRLTDVELGDVRAELDVVDEGVELYVRLGALRATSTGSFAFGAETVDLDGELDASAVAYALLTVRQTDDPDAPVEVAVEGLVVTLEAVEPDFVSPETDALLEFLLPVLLSPLEEQLVGALGDALVETIPALLADALLALDGLLAEQTFDLETDFFDPVSVAVDGGIETLTPRFGDDLLGTLSARVGTDRAIAFPDAPGVPRVEVETERPPLYRGGRLQLGVRLALLNGLLHVLWNSGLLDLDLTEVLPDQFGSLAERATLNGRLPPVLRPPRPDEDVDVVLSLGQAEADLVLTDGAVATYGLTLEVGVRLAIADGQIALTVSETPFVRVWDIVPPPPTSLLTKDVLGTLLVQLWPTLTDGLDLAFDLPLNDLGGLAGPELGGLDLALASGATVQRRGGLLIVDTTLVGQLAAPPSMDLE